VYTCTYGEDFAFHNNQVNKSQWWWWWWWWFHQNQQRKKKEEKENGSPSSLSFFFFFVLISSYLFVHEWINDDYRLINTSQGRNHRHYHFVYIISFYVYIFYHKAKEKMKTDSRWQKKINAMNRNVVIRVHSKRKYTAIFVTWMMI